ncbi:hypothetical protein [Pseudomonas sp. TNT3]|uniref:hypothetical protein n=1 Tax=Pseudomonas sp. TNT3 TaxID=2654097 RepID=UPI001390CC0A|nr:hypothetical protein [Pseudomonas sp. TNT3]KAI2693121.1 DUF2513 domain-containing protein [Pseudomonas sp. TNT3]
MKRNFEAARQILLAVQGQACTEGVDRIFLESFATQQLGVNPDDYFYNFKLLVNDGYLLPEHNSIQLTWSGHDLLDRLS